VEVVLRSEAPCSHELERLIRTLRITTNTEVDVLSLRGAPDRPLQVPSEFYSAACTVLCVQYSAILP